MDIDVGRIVFGCVLMLLVGPALWVPSMFAWRFRTENRRVRMLSQIIGATGARLLYIGLGVFVSLVGLGFIAALFPTQSGGSQMRATAPMCVLTGFDSPEIRGLLFSPDGKTLLTGEYGLRMWDIATGDQMDEIKLHDLKVPRQKHIVAMSGSVSGEWIALGFGDRTIHEQEAAVGRLRGDDLRQCEMQPVPFSVASVAITPDGRYALAVSISSLPRNLTSRAVWIDFEQAEVRELEQPDAISHVAMIGETSQTLCARSHTRLAIVDLTSGEIVGEIAPAERSRGECFALAVSHDGRVAVTCHGNGDQSVRVWDLEKRTEAYRFGAERIQSTVAMAPQSDWFVTGDRMRANLMMYNRSNGEPLQPFGSPDGSKSGIYALAVSPQGNLIAATSSGKCCIWQRRVAQDEIGDP